MRLFRDCFEPCERSERIILAELEMVLLGNLETKEAQQSGKSRKLMLSSFRKARSIRPRKISLEGHHPRVWFRFYIFLFSPSCCSETHLKFCLSEMSLTWVYQEKEKKSHVLGCCWVLQWTVARCSRGFGGYPLLDLEHAQKNCFPGSSRSNKMKREGFALCKTSTFQQIENGLIKPYETLTITISFVIHRIFSLRC